MSDSAGYATFGARRQARLIDALSAGGVVVSLVLTLGAARTVDPETMGAALGVASLAIIAKLISRRLATTEDRKRLSSSLAEEVQLPDHREPPPSRPDARQSRLAFGSGVPLYSEWAATDVDKIDDILHRTEEINRQVAEIVAITKELQSLSNEGQDVAPEGPSLC